jgi:hypothetical protein
MKRQRLWLIFVVGLGAATAGGKGGLYDETVLRTIQLQFSQPNWATLLTNNKANDNRSNTQTNIPATMIVDDVVYPGVGVRYRGNVVSYQQIGNSPKKSFNINVDYTDPNLSLMGYKTLNLLNSAGDPTFMREALYTNTCRQQIPSARANFVRLEINGENWGIYVNVQQLNGDFIKDWFPSNEGTRWRGLVDNMAGGGGRAPGGGGPVVPVRAAGDIALAEGPGGAAGGNKSALNWLGTASSSYAAVYGLKSTRQADPWASLIHTCDVLNNTPLAELPDLLDSVLQVDRALWLCAFEIVFADEDGYVSKGGGDYYLYYEPETGQIHLIQFDGNECMNQTTLELFYRVTDTSVPIMYRLVGNVPQYRQRFLAHVRTIMDLYLTKEYFAAKLDAYQALIDQEVRDDTKKLFTYQQFTSGIATLKNYPTGRRASLLANQELAQYAPPAILGVEAEAAASAAGETLTVTAQVGTTVGVSAVRLYVAPGPFALFTALPMTEVDRPAADARLFAVTLPTYPSGTVLRYYVEATAANAVHSVAFAPPGAEYKVYRHVVTSPSAASSAVVINEVMARNHSTIADPQGQYDDWIELTNVSAQAVDLSGMYLTDDANDPLQWSFPAGTTLEPGGFLLVWADNDSHDVPGLHANFALSADGETIWLYDAAARGHALLDSVTFGPLGADETAGRYPDGQGVLQVLSAPTPLAPNAPWRDLIDIGDGLLRIDH